MGQEEPSGPREQHCAETQGWVVAGVQSLSRVWVCDPMDYSMPGFPVLHYLPELSQWYHPTISSSVTLVSYLQSSLASGSFPVSWLLASGGQSIGASTSVLPMNIRGWFPLGLTDLISLWVLWTLESSPAPQFENVNSLTLSLLYGPTHIHTWLLENS